jgi:G protein-coupled receptor kinase interacting protein 2
VELLMRGMRMGSSSEGPDADQPDYDSVASDEDTDAEHSAKDDRTKVAR